MKRSRLRGPSLARGLLVLTVASWVYAGLSAWSVRRMMRSTSEDAGTGVLGPRGDPSLPPVSLLKPVRGLDWGAEETFTALLRQDYPTYEVLFAVADSDDPAVAVIERVRLAHPEVPTRLLVGAVPRPNPKVALLERMVDEAEHQVLVMADSDIRVRPDYLARVTAPLRDPGVGMVTCIYRGTAARSAAARLQALYLEVGFLPSVIVGRAVLRTGFGLGATIAMRRETIERIGGLATVADHLADDYQLGARTRAAGLRVEVAPYVVEIPLGTMTMRDLWRSEVRWARCTRVSRPLEYPGLALTLPLPLSLLWRCAQPRDRKGRWSVPAMTVALRYATAWSVTRSLQDRELRSSLPLLPLRDLLTVAVFTVAAFGRTVQWRGERYRVGGDGRMVRLPRRRGAENDAPREPHPPPTSPPPPTPHLLRIPATDAEP